MTATDFFHIVGNVIDGRYRVDAVVGEGGFGVVYRGFHLGFEKPVALKVLKIPADPRLDREAFVAAFRAEGRHLLELSGLHTSFVRALDAGVLNLPSRGAASPVAPYLVLEWLEGEALEDELVRRRAAKLRGRSLAEVIAVLDPLAQALALAHDRGVAHRDIKPANIFLADSPEGRSAKLLDFGVAKVLNDSGTAAQRNTAGMDGAMFSPAYGAPEQWNRKKYGATGPWTDVYAFALVCVELLTEAPPLHGTQPPEWLASTLDDERPTPKARGARVSEQVEEVFRKALALHVKDRTPHLRAFWNELLAAAQGRGATADSGRGNTVVGPTVVAPLSAAPLGTEPMPPAMPPGGVPPQALVAVVPPPPPQQPVGNLAKTAPWKTAGLVAGGLLVFGLGVRGLGFFDEGAPTAVAPSAPVAAASAAPSAAVPTLLPATPGMARLAGSTFQMGSETGSDAEKPVHSVTVPSFQMDITEVTVEAYAACVKDGKCTEPDSGTYCNWKKPARDRHPINCVDWEQATAYCGSVGKRLPTEEEWEYAARGTAGREYPWGSAAPSNQLCWDRLGDGKPNSTCTVGSYSAGSTPEGLMDMAGNVWEWTSSPYCPYGSNGCAETARVLRGGCWYYSSPSYVRGANRYFYAPSFRFYLVGFRCARAN